MKKRKVRRSTQGNILKNKKKEDARLRNWKVHPVAVAKELTLGEGDDAMKETKSDVDSIHF